MKCLGGCILRETARQFQAYCFPPDPIVILDDGPFRIFARLRDWACTLPQTSLLRHLLCGYDDKPTDGILFCCYCCSVWIAFAVAPLVLFPTAIGDAILTILGIAGAAVVLERSMNHY